MAKIATIAWQRLNSVISELWLGIETRGAVAPLTEEGIHYTPLPYSVISKMQKLLDLKANDVFYDVGCGKGRVVCCLCRLPIKKVVAIELNEILLKKTMENVAKLRGQRCPVVPMLKSAEACDYSEATVLYLYNPFNARLTSLVVEQLFKSYQASPRPIRVVYANPVHEQVLLEHNWLEKYAECTADEFPILGYPVTFWKTR